MNSNHSSLPEFRTGWDIERGVDDVEVKKSPFLADKAVGRNAI